MKRFSIAILSSVIMLSACVDLNLNPLSESSSATWFSAPEEFEMTTADIYRTEFFPVMTSHYADDIANRVNVPTYYAGTLTAESTEICTWWTNLYKGITRMQGLLANIDKGKQLGISQSKLDQYEGEANFYIGFAYSWLAFHWGDVPLYKEKISLPESYKLPRTPKAEVMAYAYECFDKAIEKLPVKYAGVQRATKGAALGMKARAALYNGDYAIAAAAAKACMDLGEYELHNNYESLFTADYSKEWIFYFRGSVPLEKYYFYYDNVKKGVPRTAGGLGQLGMTYELFCAYLCTDGLPIDKSPLYNPKDPFENRDPRLAMTIVPFATAHNKKVLAGEYDPKDYEWLGYEYTPSPLRPTCLQFSSGKQVTNSDSKGRAEHANYNGLQVKKFVDQTWLENSFKGTNTCLQYLRYGDVLLMYAEAMIEQNKCTQEVLDQTINKIRERAYNGSGIAYPKLVLGTQKQMRTALRTERYVELAFEKHRMADLYRWRIAEYVMSRPLYYLERTWSGKTNWNGDESQVSDAYRRICQNWKDGNFPIGGIPTIDENGIADVSYMVDAGYIAIAAKRSFRADRDYLWPIPAADLLVNENLKNNQNPNW